MTTTKVKQETKAEELARLGNNAIVSLTAFYGAALGDAVNRADTYLGGIEAMKQLQADEAKAVDGAKPKTTKKAADAKGPSLEDEVVSNATIYVEKPIAFLSKCEAKSPAYSLGEAVAQHFEIPTDRTRKKILEAAIANVEADKLDTAPSSNPAFKRLAASVDALQRKRRRAKKRG